MKKTSKNEDDHISIFFVNESETSIWKLTCA